MFLSVKWVVESDYKLVFVCVCVSVLIKSTCNIKCEFERVYACVRVHGGALEWAHKSFWQQPKYQNKFSNEYYSLVWLIDFRRAFATALISFCWYNGCRYFIFAAQIWKTHFNVRAFPVSSTFKNRRIKHTNFHPMENCFAFHFSTHPDHKIFTRNGFATLVN